MQREGGKDMERLLEAVFGTGTETAHGIRVEKFGKNIYLTTKNGIDEFVLNEDENYYDKVLEILTKKFEEIKNSVGHIIDTKIMNAGSVIRTAVIFFYLSNEGISIIENVSLIGLPVPKKLKEVLEQIQNKSDEDKKE